MTVSGEIAILEKYLHYSISGINGEKSRGELDFLMRNFAKTRSTGSQNVN